MSVVKLGDKQLGSQSLTSEFLYKKSYQDCHMKRALGYQQLAQVKIRTLASANMIRYISATSLFLNSGIYVITVLANLNSHGDNSSQDMSFSLQQAMTFRYLQKFQKATRTEFYSLIRK